MSWKNGIWPRKPEPGFHPGIYGERCCQREAIDPYVHYLQNGKPNGVWKNCLITPESNGEIAIGRKLYCIYTYTTLN